MKRANKRSRHMECKYNLEREHLQMPFFFHVSSKEQPADLLTEDLGVLLMNKIRTVIIGMQLYLGQRWAFRN